VKEVLAASRPFSWVNTAYPFAAGYLMATGGRLDATFVLGTLFFLVPYNLAMYGVNDVFDYASDLRNPRKGGIEGALVAPERARAVHRRILVAAAVTVLSPFSSSSARWRRARCCSSCCSSWSPTRRRGCGSRSGRCSTR